MVFAFSTIFSVYILNSGLRASPNATAFAAITCISGPPCTPGITEASSNSETIFTLPDLGAFFPQGFSKSLPIIIIPPLGPLRVLCVVLVTTSQYFIGEGCTPDATRPLGCAISAIRKAPIESATFRNSSNSTYLGYALPPQMISLGLCFWAKSLTSLKSTLPVSFDT